MIRKAILTIGMIAGAETNAYNGFTEKDEVCVNQFLLKNYDVALAACSKSAKIQPSYINQLNLGNIWLNGFGVERNIEKAMQYFLNAAQLPGGDGTAEHNLGYAHSMGVGFKKDLNIAVSYYEKAAKSGHEESQYNLGLSYFSGEGKPIDYIMGTAWLVISEQYGSKEAEAGLQQVKVSIPSSDFTAGHMKAAEIIKTLPISRKERAERIKEELLKTINES